MNQKEIVCIRSFENSFMQLFINSMKNFEEVEKNDNTHTVKNTQEETHTSVFDKFDDKFYIPGRIVRCIEE